jgi:hypothetical protein
MGHTAAFEFTVFDLRLNPGMLGRGHVNADEFMLYSRSSVQSASIHILF